MSEWRADDFTFEIQDKSEAFIGWCEDDEIGPNCGPGDCEGHYDMSKIPELWSVEGPEKTYPYNDVDEGYFYSKKTARLIAAAPDLLAALRAARQAFYDYQMEVDEEPPYKHRLLMNEVERAIAKATLGAEGIVRHG